MTIEPFRRGHDIGLFPDYPGPALLKVNISWNGERLSITGTHRGGGGQCRDLLLEVDDFRNGWDADSCRRLRNLWERWHLNDLRPGCEHQRAEMWDKRPIDPDKPLRSYGRHFDGQTSDSWNMLTWVRPSEHPDGLLTKPCGTCGYEYGTAWLTEEIPDEILLELQGLPNVKEA